MWIETYDQKAIDKEKARYVDYPIPKWLFFCEFMLKKGYEIQVHKAVTTRSKYVYVKKDFKMWKVRFSNHKPNRRKQDAQDSDFYVGVSHTGAITTEKVIEKILAWKPIPKGKIK